MLVKPELVASTLNLEEKIPLVSLPKKQHKILRLNSICPYYTMFPLEFPFNSLHSAHIGDWVLDPFCGRGTTNFAARLRGLPSIGLDANPVATAVARAKFVNTTPKKIFRICEKILAEKHEPDSIPEGEFWGLCYHPETLRQITQIRDSLLEECSTPERKALLATMLGILHGPVMKGEPSYLSNQMPRTYATKPGPAIKYWNKKGNNPRYIDVLDLIKRRTNFVFSLLPPAVEGEAFAFDGRIDFEKVVKKNFKWVITSPPYYGMRSYVPDQWLRYWFVGGPPVVVYDQERFIRHNSIEHFIEDLARVWKNTALVCDSGAHLFIRFGTLPSLSKEPASMLTESIHRSDCGWCIKSVVPAGDARRGRRQSDQFLQEASTPCEEIDFCAVLER